MEYEKFKYIMTDSRNSFFIPNRLFGTYNPDPDSWVAKFIDWWIKWRPTILLKKEAVWYDIVLWEDWTLKTFLQFHGVIQEKEVYQKIKHLLTIYTSLLNILILVCPRQEMFIKSACFIEGSLEENIIILRSSPEYVSNLANQSMEDIERDLKGNWKYKSVGDDLINISNMEAFFKNDFQYGDKKRRASCDAFLTVE